MASPDSQCLWSTVQKEGRFLGRQVRPCNRFKGGEFLLDSDWSRYCGWRCGGRIPTACVRAGLALTVAMLLELKTLTCGAPIGVFAVIVHYDDRVRVMSREQGQQVPYGHLQNCIEFIDYHHFVQRHSFASSLKYRGRGSIEYLALKNQYSHASVSSSRIVLFICFVPLLVVNQARGLGESPQCVTDSCAAVGMSFQTKRFRLHDGEVLS